MPTPKKGESKKDFIERCVPKLINEGKPTEQAVAICSSMYEKSKADEMDLIMDIEVCKEYSVEFKAIFDGQTFSQVVVEVDDEEYTAPDIDLIGLMSKMGLDPTKRYKFEFCAEEC